MESIDALAKAIKEFEGGVVIVSHDFRAFLLSVDFITAVLINILRRSYFPGRRRAVGSGGQDDQELDKEGYQHHRLQEEPCQTECVTRV